MFQGEISVPRLTGNSIHQIKFRELRLRINDEKTLKSIHKNGRLSKKQTKDVHKTFKWHVLANLHKFHCLFHPLDGERETDRLEIDRERARNANIIDVLFNLSKRTLKR